MTTLALDRQAAAVLQHLQAKTGPIDAEVEQKIAEACEAGGKLSAAALSQVLLQAMPDQKKDIEQAKDKCLGYQCDGNNSAFLSQILSIRVEKEIDVVRSRPVRNTGPFARDPYYSTFTMDPKADFMLLFNARDVDRNGRPLLMKVVARERADLSKLDLSEYRTREGNGSDVRRIDNDADYIEVKDEHENEFEFGDPLKQISLDRKGCEISTTVKTAPQNTLVVNTYWPQRGNATQPDLTRPTGAPARRVGGDRTPVTTFDDRVRIKPQFSDDFLTNGGWTHSRVGEDYELFLETDRGFMFEPGATANITIVGAELNTEVPADDAQLLGSAHTEVAFKGTNLNTILRSTPRMTTGTNGVNAAENLEDGAALLGAFPPDLAAKISVAGSAFAPYGTSKLTDLAEAKLSATKVPTPNDPEKDSQRVSVNLDPGFIAPSDGASIKGWKVIAGYTGMDGKWHGTKPMQINDPDKFPGHCFTVDVDRSPELMAKDRPLEIRVFNQDNVPAQKIEIPLRKIKWAQ